MTEDGVMGVRERRVVGWRPESGLQQVSRQLLYVSGQLLLQHLYAKSIYLIEKRTLNGKTSMAIEGNAKHRNYG
jgi:hypothetical protein